MAPEEPPGRAGGEPGRGTGVPGVGVRAQIACLAELAAPNPGNVRPGHDLPGLTAAEMWTSAAAIGPAMAAAGEVPLGRTLLRAVRATRRWVDTNTNLGIVLLLAPPARAAGLLLASGPAGGTSGRPNGGDGRADPEGAGRERPALGEEALWRRLEEVLAGADVEDARLAYRAIRLAEPGGLGRVDDQDVADEPTVPLREAMRRAAERDEVAAAYADGYRLAREVGLPAVRSARREGLGWEGAAHRCFARLLAERPDSLLARKHGAAEAAAVRGEAAHLLEAGPPEAPELAPDWAALDRRLRSADPPLNPGTTADLTAAAVFLALLLDVGWNSAVEAP